MTLRLIKEKPLWPEAKEVTQEYFYAVGSQIPTNREYLVNRALEEDCTHILFIDDDMTWDAKAFELLSRRRHPIVGVNYRVRLPPGRFTAIHLTEPGVTGTQIKTTKEATGLVPAKYMGFGLCLIEARVFKAVERPWFLQFWENGQYSTEDLPFFNKAREAGFIAYVDQDASKYVGHIGSCDYRWHTEYPVPPVVIERGDYEKLKGQS
jgi:hypothetical protein